MGRNPLMACLSFFLLFMYFFYDIFLPYKHAPDLDQGRYYKNAGDNIMNHRLVMLDFGSYKAPAKNKKAVSQQGAYTNTHRIKVIMLPVGQQYFFSKQDGAPAKPERYLHGVYSTHRQAQDIRRQVIVEYNIFIFFRVRSGYKTGNSQGHYDKQGKPLE